LLRASAAGDRAAFERLYQVTSPQLFGLALRMARRRDLAEEIVQETYLAAWRHASRFDEQRGTALAWLAVILRNEAFDRLRRLKREILVADPPEGEPDAAPDLGGYAPRDLARCLEELDEGPRRSLLLAYYEGLSMAEVAERARAPIGTVKSWIRRGLMRLKGCLER
jgi:RNA polymerase sigma-70 factor (ECF subfamily)